MANWNTSDHSSMADELRSIMCNLEGVIYALDSMADKRTEATNALRNQSWEIDRAFARLESMADALEKA